MQDTIWIHSLYQSQFDLLGAMSEELLEAFTAKGYDARIFDLAPDNMPTEGTLFFMNTSNSLQGLPPALFTPDSNMRAIQYYVDHPFGLSDGSIDQWDQINKLSNYRLALPCIDDAHLLRYRFPNLIHGWIPHGIPRSALCDLGTLTPEHFANREFDVVVTSSVRPQEEIDEAIAEIKDPGMVQLINSIANMMIRDPQLGYVAACDLALGTKGIITGKWITQRHLWGLVIAIVNRYRRIETVKALQGLKVGVFGSEEWAKHCTGTIKYAGQASYAECADAFSRGRIGLAWGPTQFVHSYSERIMQAMAGGACVVADDRLMVRHDFNGSMSAEHTDPTATLFDWSGTNLHQAREKIDALLAQPDVALKQAIRGRMHAERTCLWEHRVDQMYNLVNSCPRPTAQPA
ncbi:MAG: glycosyltransferase [Phycisphaerales bacterium]|nr:glycosyltransferase [Phycisphaerales bacterium]